MKKHIIKIAFVAAFAAIAGYGVYTSQKSVTLSDLALANVEALAQSEIETYHGFSLKNENGCNVCRRDSGTCNVHDQTPC